MVFRVIVKHDDYEEQHIIGDGRRLADKYVELFDQGVRLEDIIVKDEGDLL